MRYSRVFGKTKKEIPKKFEAKSQELLIRAGFIDQVASGIYTLLPLGQWVLKKIEKIIREEMEAIGAQEILMPSLHPKSLWEKTNRWDSFDALFKTKSRYGAVEYALGPTHEEIVTPLAAKFIQSYRDLPAFLYHLSAKFRDEPRPKSGILRGREFGMKDLYSFHESKTDLEKFYEKVKKAYLAIFLRCGLFEVKISEASGGAFTKKFSHEFNVITPAGEVDLIYCPHCSFAQNKEVAQVKSGDKCLNCFPKEIHTQDAIASRERRSFLLKEARAIEVGNIFDLGEKFARDFNLKFRDRQGQEKYVVMGCYGIGTTRLIGTVVEIHHDEKGIIWPKEIAPYEVHLIEISNSKSQIPNGSTGSPSQPSRAKSRDNIQIQNPKSKTYAEEIYQKLKNVGVQVLYDEREEVSAGEKLVTADLIGIPVRLVVSKKTKGRVEWKERKSKKTELLNLEELIKRFKDEKNSCHPYQS